MEEVWKDGQYKHFLLRKENNAQKLEFDTFETKKGDSP